MTTRLTGNVVADGSEYSYLDWAVTTQEVENNRSLISWVVGWHFVTYGCRGLRNADGTVQGSLVYSDHVSGDHVHPFNGAHNHLSGGGDLPVQASEIWVSHNEDGTQTLTAAVNITGFSGQVSSGSGSWALPTIARFTSPPSTPVISEVTDVSFRAVFTDGTGGAVPIDDRELGWSETNELPPEFTMSSDGDDVIEDLFTGSTYFVWARTHNAAGWSDWSDPAIVETHGIPDEPDTPTISEVAQTSFLVSWDPPESDGGSPILEYHIAVNDVDDPDTADVFPSPTSPKLITGLDPFTTYYVWVKAVNDVGDGGYSSSTSDTTLAGARINDGGVWKQAIPYVKNAGNWDVAAVWTKVSGTWRETI